MKVEGSFGGGPSRGDGGNLDHGGGGGDRSEKWC